MRREILPNFDQEKIYICHKCICPCPHLSNDPSWNIGYSKLSQCVWGYLTDTKFALWDSGGGTPQRYKQQFLRDFKELRENHGWKETCSLKTPRTGKTPHD